MPDWVFTVYDLLMLFGSFFGLFVGVLVLMWLNTLLQGAIPNFLLCVYAAICVSGGLLIGGIVVIWVNSLMEGFELRTWAVLLTVLVCIPLAIVAVTIPLEWILRKVDLLKPDEEIF
jgi:hypothetical protein